jgi:Mitochondrial carrier protein
LSGKEENFTVHFCYGMIAETICCIVYVPVDVVKEHLQVQQQLGGTSSSTTYYKNTFGTLNQIAKTEGISGIYRGYAATLASFGPFSVYFVFYEESKQQARQCLCQNESSLDRRKLPFQWLVLCSAGSGALASWLMSPLDLAKLRLQVQRGKLQSLSQSTTIYCGVIDCLQSAYDNAGLGGLFRGAGARVLHFAPATCITMTTYEMFRSFVSRPGG